MSRLFWIAFLALLGTFCASAQQTTLTEDVPLSADQLEAQKINCPQLVRGERPEFSVDAISEHTGGLCSLSLVVDVQGNPHEVRTLHCTDPAFEETSLAAAKQSRFNPASTQDGKPVPVRFRLIERYHIVHPTPVIVPFMVQHYLFVIDASWIPKMSLTLDRHMSKGEIQRDIDTQVQFGFIPQQGGPSMPDSDGVYPLTRSVTGPRLIRFSDKGYASMAFLHEGNSTCDVMLTINPKGKASDPRVMHCEQPELEKVVMESLLKSDYKPGFVHGKEVSMRGLLHLTYGMAQSGSQK
jgi:hypothetical protein